MRDETELRALTQQVYTYLNYIRKKLQTENRFFADDEFLKGLGVIFEEASRDVPTGTIYYRARKFPSEMQQDIKIGAIFEGYDAEGSFVNKSSAWPRYGRMNPQGIHVLYLATDVRTAVTEMHPYYDELYSVATIETTKPLRIADLSASGSSLNDDFLRMLSVYIQEWLPQGAEEKDYVLTQYIASYCKHLGYDGIGYRSKYATRENARKKSGVNLAVFNYDKCTVTGSKIYAVGRVSVSLNPKFRQAKFDED